MNTKNETWIFLGLIVAAFGLVLIARRPLINLPMSIAGPVSESEQAWKEAQEAKDLLSTYENETGARLRALENAYLQQSLQREMSSSWSPGEMYEPLG